MQNIAEVQKQKEFLSSKYAMPLTLVPTGETFKAKGTVPRVHKHHPEKPQVSTISTREAARNLPSISKKISLARGL